MTNLELVEFILKKWPYARNCDNYLIYKFYKMYYPGKIDRDSMKIDLYTAKNLIMTIVRYRALLRNKYPADPEIEQHRRRLESDSRKRFRKKIA